MLPFLFLGRALAGGLQTVEIHAVTQANPCAQSFLDLVTFPAKTTALVRITTDATDAFWADMAFTDGLSVTPVSGFETTRYDPFFRSTHDVWALFKDQSGAHLPRTFVIMVTNPTLADTQVMIYGGLTEESSRGSLGDPSCKALYGG